MKLELKAIKHSEFASEETHCYEGKLYVDGVFTATVSNDGHGGPDHYWPASSAKVTEQDIDKWLKANVAPQNVFGMTIECDLAIWCGDQINAWLRNKEVRRLINKTKTAVLTVDNKNQIWTHKWKGCKQITEKHLEAIALKFPERRIVNLLSREQQEAVLNRALEVE